MENLVLDATNKSITAVLAGAVTSNQLECVATWADNTGTVFTEGSTTVATNSTTPVTVVGSPGASTRRIIRGITIYNKDTVAANVTVGYLNNATTYILAKFNLGVNESWTVDGTYDVNGNLKVVYGTSAVPTVITVANEATDTSCFPLFATAATGDLGPKTVSTLTFNSNTGALGTTSIELGHASDTTITRSAAGVIAVEGVVIPSISSTNTLTNKRVTKRVTAITSHATPTINTDDCDCVDITAQAEAITSMTTNLSGTPTNKQTLVFQIKDNGTARAIAWGTSFVAGGVALPTTTVLSKILTVGFIYNTANSLNKWMCIASAQEA